MGGVRPRYCHPDQPGRDPGSHSLWYADAQVEGQYQWFETVLLLGPVSGTHFNPAVTLAAWFTGRRLGNGLTLRDVAAYVPAQIAGAIGGAILADAMFAKPLVKLSTHDRSAGHLWLVR